MAEERAQRRLAAILAANRLSALKQHRAALIDPVIAGHRGRIVNVAGDGLLAEFSSAVDAVECAIAIQHGMVERNVDIPGDKRIVLRIGVNLGDVIIDGDDIYGDGINVAARLEGLAEPGGICISAKVHAEVGNKLDVGLEDLGAISVKNISAPVRCYRVTLDRAPVSPKKAPSPRDKPSVAVLPFVNMSGDPEQEYFSDGMAEDLITDFDRDVPDLRLGTSKRPGIRA